MTTAADLRAGGAFTEAVFDGLDLGGELLIDVEAEGCRFVSCDFSGARLENWSLVDCEFRSCDLTLLEVPRSSFRGVRFVECRLLGVDWSPAATALGFQVRFERCVLDGSSFVKLAPEELEMVECRGRDLNFGGADLTGARFPESTLEGARFQGTDLTRADFSGATGVLFDPAENCLHQTRLSLEAAVGILDVAGIVVDGM